VCSNGEVQENTDNNRCSRWFHINHCDKDDTCTVTNDGYQTRCDLDVYAKTHFLKDAGITSAGEICSPDYLPGVPLNSHSTGIKVNAWELCPWCCNYCNETEAISTRTFFKMFQMLTGLY
jgi:hypothetical protein